MFLYAVDMRSHEALLSGVMSYNKLNQGTDRYTPEIHNFRGEAVSGGHDTPSCVRFYVLIGGGGGGGEGGCLEMTSV